jgi:Flp pilus assembly protein TadB
MARSASLRASDADRDMVAERLRQAAVEGRLEPDELEERLHTALRARTYGELDRLTGDLPRRTPARSRPAAPSAGLVLAIAVRLVVLLVVVSALLVAFAVTAAWWLLGIIVWLSLRASRGSCARRAALHHQPRAWRA